MSFLTLFTADAAAAHGHEFSRPNSTPIPYTLQMKDSSSPLHRLSAMTSPVPTTVYEDSDSLSPQQPPPPKRLPRSKTSYHLAQPPPGSHHTFKPSRSLVVQLQRLSNFTRPVPTFDVLPASVFAPRLKRKVGKFFKNGVGMQDLVFLTSEDFGGDDDDEEDEESLSSRHVVASVSAGYKKVHGEEGKGVKITIIRLDNGPQWEVSQNSTGGYEFVAYEDDGTMLVARWNPKSASPKRRSYQTQNSECGDEEKKFQFSLVNPNSRKHPILGSLAKQTIEINDHYPLPSMSSPLASPNTTPPQSRSGSPVGMSPLGAAFQLADERVMVKTSEHMRTLILVSGIWVALREGLVTSNMRLDEPLSPCPLSPSSSLFPNGRLSPSYVRPTITARSASDPPGKSVFDDAPTIRRPTRTNTVGSITATNPYRHSTTPEESEHLTLPRRANSLGVPTTRHRAHTTGSVSRNFGRSSPVPESSKATTRTSTRANTPEPPKPATTRMPATPATPPTIGCLNRRSVGHKHTGSVSLPNSPEKYREKQRQSQVVNPVEEVRKGEKEKRKWGKHIRGLVNMLKRATS